VFLCKITVAIEPLAGVNFFDLFVAMRRFGILLLAAAWAIASVGAVVARADDEAAPAAESKAPIEAEQNGSKPARGAKGEADHSPAAEQIAAWIKDLDDQRYQVREEASQHLVGAESAALDPLLTVANGDRPEPADRAIWIMRRFSHSKDEALSRAALEHLADLENRPSLVAKALTELAQRDINACQERLTPLGADLVMQIEPIDPPNVAAVLTLRLGSRWHGTTDDLLQVAQLKQQRYFRLEGAPINDEVAKMFSDKEKLSVLQLIDTKVSPTAVDAIKEKHPDATVYVRNQALLGVQAENHAAGVRVIFVQPNSAADKAGIKQGDVISTIDGHKLADFDRLTARIAQHQPGDKIDLEILRNEKPTTLQVVLGSRAGLVE
jgi:hypothetical protein